MDKPYPFSSLPGARRILYIEANRELALLVQRRLHELGIETELAFTAEEGLTMFNPARHEIVLLDYHLPDLTGTEVIRRLNARQSKTPAILLTSTGDERVAVEALHLGAADYIVRDRSNAYLELLPAVMHAALARILLARQNRKQQEQLLQYAERLRISEERLHLALEGSETGVWDWDIKKGVLYLSENMRKALGMEPTVAPTLQLWLERIHPDDRVNVETAMEMHMEKMTPLFHTLYREHPLEPSEQEEWNWSLVRGVALWDKRGTPCRMVGTRTDFTPYKRLEQQLEIAKNRAESASQAKSQFLANMSHEIRTPMNAVIGLANILAQTPLTIQQQEIVHTLQSSADILLRLIDDILDISRIEARRVTLDQAPFALDALLEEVYRMMLMEASLKGLKVRLEAGSLRGRQFVGDSARVRQILLNLCVNAVKFTEKGEVRITAGAKEEAGDERLISIQVRDTGLGIAPEKTKQIFEAFIQGDQSITRRFGGTGLGLAISRSFAQLMNGDITVESEPGRGSVFTFSLRLPEIAPKAQEEAPPAAPRPARTEASTPHTVLLVEDYQPNIIVATLLLESLGYRYEVASTGMEALEKIEYRGQRFSAILMDVQMQGMDGFETTRRIRAHECKSGTGPHYIIGLTAHAMAGDRERCLKAGMDEYMTKPINTEELQEKLAYGCKRSVERLMVAV